MPPLHKTPLIIFSVLFILFSACNKNAPTPAPLKNTQPPSGPSTPSTNLGLYFGTEVGTGLYPQPDYSKSINGYTDKLSYQPGDSVSLYISGPHNSSQLIALTDINNKVVFSVNTPVDLQQINTQKPWVDGLLFKKTISVKLPDNLKSGIYYWFGKAPIICKDKGSIHDVTVVYPTNTENAYNETGGKSLYYPVNGRSTVASFSRFQYQNGASDFTSSFLKWISTQPYTINYISDTDLDDYTQIQNSKVVIIIGHSEYWTRQARENTDNFVKAGKNLLVLSGNTMWWQVRYNLSKNLMICYKDNNLDPLSNTLYSTANWPESYLNYPTINSIGADFNGGGYGNVLPNRLNGFKIVSQSSPLFEGTGLKNGDILKVPSGEMDGAPVTNMILPGSLEIPVIDNTKLKFYQVQLLGFDFTIHGTKPGLGTFIVFKKTASSGTVVNVASTNWCSPTGMGGTDKGKLEQITKNMISKSVNNQPLL